MTQRFFDNFWKVVIFKGYHLKNRSELVDFDFFGVVINVQGQFFVKIYEGFLFKAHSVARAVLKRILIIKFKLKKTASNL